MKPFVRDPYNYDLAKASDETGSYNTEPSLAVQEQAEDADINEIVRRFGMGAPMPENARAPTYGDFSNITDYQSAIDAIKDADRSFLALPAEIRAKFENNPQQLLIFANENANADVLQSLGFGVQPATPEPGEENAKP